MQGDKEHLFSSVTTYGRIWRVLETKAWIVANKVYWYISFLFYYFKSFLVYNI